MSTVTRRLLESDLEPLNARLEGRSPAEIISWAHNVFGKRLALLSAFQESGMVLCHMISALGLQDSIDIIFVDTGVNFQETLDTVARSGAEYGLNIVTLHPDRTMEQQTREEGVLYLTTAGQKRCCELRKKVPLKQILGKYDAMIGSLRREEGGARGNIAAVSLDTEMNMLRVYPLLNMTREELEKYIEEHNVIVNPLHAQGYPTISCNRCTTPVVEGEDERAGRWRHLQNAPKYCNINSSDRTRTGSINLEPDHVDLEEGVVERMMGK